MTTILDKLSQYSKEDYVPMHMPGHKRNQKLFKMDNPYGLDITEIEGFDNLHDPKEILRDSMEAAAEMYGSNETFFLINGSTAGILAAVSAVTKKRNRVLIARNCHNSVYNSIYLNELNPVYIYPQNVNELGINGQISPEDVNIVLKTYKNIKAVLITSPTYEGIVSDIRSISNIVHKHGIPLIVDEAHGAHFHFHQEFPEPAIQQGADIVIQSIHKTLPALTQTALLHVKSEYADSNAIKKYLSIYQTTSPSYILLAGIDSCLAFLRKEGVQLFEKYIKNLKKLRTELPKLEYICMFQTDDISKIILYTKNGCLNGKQIYDILVREYYIQLEMAAVNYVVAMTAAGDKNEYYSRFFDALKDLDQRIAQGEFKKVNTKTKRILENPNEFILQPKMNPYDAMNAETVSVSVKEAEGRICAKGIVVYPPGVPVVYAGEVISEPIAEYIRSAVEAGLEVIGLDKDRGVFIQCLK